MILGFSEPLQPLSPRFPWKPGDSDLLPRNLVIAFTEFTESLSNPDRESWGVWGEFS